MYDEKRTVEHEAAKKQGKMMKTVEIFLSTNIGFGKRSSVPSVDRSNLALPSINFSQAF